MNGDGHHSTLTADAKLDLLIDHVLRLEAEVSRLQEAVRRPERVRYRPAKLAGRLGVSPATVYNLWKRGQMQYKKDGRGRFSTEAQVQAYERDFVHSGKR